MAARPSVPGRPDIRGVRAMRTMWVMPAIRAIRAIRALRVMPAARAVRTRPTGAYRATLVLPAALGLAGCAALRSAAPGGYAPVRTESHVLVGDEVRVHQPAGSVVVESTPGPAVVVRITYFGPDAGRLRTRIDRDDEGSEMSVVYPDTARRIVYPRLGPFMRCSFWMRTDGSFGHGFPTGRQVTVSRSGEGVRAYTAMRVAVPPGTELDLYLGAGAATIRGVRGTLEIDTRSATVDVAGGRGPLEIDTGSGDVRVEDVVGPLDVNTGTGDVVLRGVRGPRIEVETGTGDITGRSVSAPVLDLETGFGEIDVTGAGPTGNIDRVGVDPSAARPVHGRVSGPPRRPRPGSGCRAVPRPRRSRRATTGRRDGRAVCR